MNPLTNVKNITKLNETELATGLIHKKSWHDMYKDSAWIFIGGLEYGLTEGDVIAVFSQYGEIENINLVRDKKTGKSKGYCFLCYSNQKSTVLAVDNFNGIKLCNRTIRVDHVANYKPPKENERDDEVTKVLKSEGCAPQVVQKLITKETPDVKNDGTSEGGKSKKKKSKKEKKEKKKKKRKYKSNSDVSDKETHAAEEVKVKKERHDPGYDKYDMSANENRISNKRRDQRRVDYSNGECSYSNRTDKSSVSTKYFKTERNDDFNIHKVKIKTEPESDRDYFQADRDNIPSKERQKIKSRSESKNKKNSDSHHTSSKKHKRKRSSSSSSLSDSSYHKAEGYSKKYKHKNDRDDSKRSVKRKKKSKNVKDSSTSGSDDASSTQSSSEDENRGDRYSRKDKYKMQYETIRSNREDGRDRSYDRTEEFYSSSRSKHYDKAEMHFEHKSRTSYKDDGRDDSSYKDSHYHKRKSDK